MEEYLYEEVTQTVFPFLFGFPNPILMAMYGASIYGVPPQFYPFLHDPGRSPFLPRL